VVEKKSREGEEKNEGKGLGLYRVLVLNLDWRKGDRLSLGPWQDLLAGNWNPPQGWRLVSMSVTSLADGTPDSAYLVLEREVVKKKYKRIFLPHDARLEEGIAAAQSLFDTTGVGGWNDLQSRAQKAGFLFVGAGHLFPKEKT